MKELIYVFLGGGVGSVLRYLISSSTSKVWTYNQFPVGTFLVNILGCFTIGILVSYFAKTDLNLRFLLITGFCGGFTTFSTFASENVELYQNGDFFTLFLYITASLIIGFLAVIVGLQIFK